MGKLANKLRLNPGRCGCSAEVDAKGCQAAFLSSQKKVVQKRAPAKKKTNFGGARTTPDPFATFNTPQVCNDLPGAGAAS